MSNTGVLLLRGDFARATALGAVLTFLGGGDAALVRANFAFFLRLRAAAGLFGVIGEGKARGEKRSDNKREEESGSFHFGRGFAKNLSGADVGCNARLNTPQGAALTRSSGAAMILPDTQCACTPQSHPMKNPNNPTPRKRVVFVATLSVCGALLFLPLTRAAGNSSSTQLADKAAPLPVSTSFEKVSSGEDRGQSVLIVKNTSPEALKVTAAIVESVTFHANPKNRTLPEHRIESGKDWKIEGLARGDKITLTAAGFEPLEVTVP